MDNNASISTGLRETQPWIPTYGLRGLIWFQAVVSFVLVLTMQLKAIRQFSTIPEPLSTVQEIDRYVTLCYPLLFAIVVVFTFFSMRRLFRSIPRGVEILRVISNQGLLILNLALLEMAVLRH